MVDSRRLLEGQGEHSGSGRIEHASSEGATHSGLESTLGGRRGARMSTRAALELQRTAGNRAASKLLSRPGGGSRAGELDSGAASERCVSALDAVTDAGAIGEAALQRLFDGAGEERPAQTGRLDGVTGRDELRSPAGKQAVERKSEIAVQRLVDVYDAKAFANPVAYLKGDAKKGEDFKVVEEPGSQGIGGVPDRKAIAMFANEKKRAALDERIGARIDRLALLFDDNDIQKAKNARNDVDDLVLLRQGLADVNDERSAQIFYRQNTLRLSKLGLSPTEVHNKGANGAKSRVFHKDSGLVTVDKANLTGGQKDKSKKAEALNGPFATGWVRGHNAIANMKHRFIEHIHVNKGMEDDSMDIYNGTAKQGEKAEAWESKGDLLTPGGMDADAVNAAIRARDEQDLVPNM